MSTQKKGLSQAPFFVSVPPVPPGCKPARTVFYVTVSGWVPLMNDNRRRARAFRPEKMNHFVAIFIVFSLLLSIAAYRRREK